MATCASSINISSCSSASASRTRAPSFNVRGQVAGGRAILSGDVEFIEHKKALAQFFKYLNLKIEDRIELLPALSLGNRRFAMITTDRAFVYDKPSGRRETLT